MEAQYIWPSDMFAVSWPGHAGLYLHNATAVEVRMLDPHDSVEGKYRVLATLPL